MPTPTRDAATPTRPLKRTPHTPALRHRRTNRDDRGPDRGGRSAAPSPAEEARATRPSQLARRLLAEGLGTFALTTVAAGGDMAGVISAGQVDHVARAVAPGLLVMAFIYALGDASGAHFNPGVTLAFAVKRVFPTRWVVPYWLAQFAGAIAAALVLRAVLGDVADLGASKPHVAQGSAVVVEAVLTWMLITVILGTADRYRLVGPNAALAVGATIALDGLIGGPISGGSMNTARSLGPMFAQAILQPAHAATALRDGWVYVLGPLAGALLAVGTTWLLHGRAPDGKTREAAQGSDDAPADPGDAAHA